MGLASLVLGMVLFLATHLFARSAVWRPALIARLGKTPYRILFSIVSTGILALIVYGFARYRAEEWIDVWYPPLSMRHITLALMLPAVILLFAAFLPGHIRTWTRYPALLAVKIWAFAHLLANGDLGSIILFGGFLAWAVIARIMLKRAPPAEAGGNDGGWFNDGLAVVLGVVAYAALGFVFHPVVIGVPVFGG
jgi:uncharacterized membrane protein